MRALLIIMTTFLFVATATAQYSGGSGTVDDPYHIATAADLIALGETPDDYDKHFILTADIDLDPNLPGGKVFERAVIAPDTDPSVSGFQGTSFTGIFDGNGRTISHLTVAGTSYVGLFGLLYCEARISDLGVEAIQVNGTGDYVGGLLGRNYGSITTSYSTGTVSGAEDVGGLVGINGGNVTHCYSTGIVGGNSSVGGLVGGNYGALTHCHSAGSVSAVQRAGGLVGANLFGWLGRSWDLEGRIKHCCSIESVTGDEEVGGLAGINDGIMVRCYSKGQVNGSNRVGGLVGHNSRSLSWGYSPKVIQCYGTSAVAGDAYVGGLAGSNSGDMVRCYSAGAVRGRSWVGGFTGSNDGRVNRCFWDTETSGLSNMCGNPDDDAPGRYGDYGKGTAKMQTAVTFLNAGWDFVDEMQNGGRDIWRIVEGQDYPRLTWERWAFFPDPWDGAADVTDFRILSWHSAVAVCGHDVYFGKDAYEVATATNENSGVYCGRQPTDHTTYDPGVLDRGTTYYWRVDEVNDADPNSPENGSVWSFTTANFDILLVVDDFESYNNDSPNRVFQTWIDATGNSTGGYVWHGIWTVDIPHPPLTLMEKRIVHGGQQSMPFYYFNDDEPYHSKTERTFTTPSYWTPDTEEAPQDWTINDADTLTLSFRREAANDSDPFYVEGEVTNDSDPFYVEIEDSTGRIAVVKHPDPDAVRTAEWRSWHISLADLQAAGVNVASVKKMTIGIGDSEDPQPGGTGLIYIDDVWITKRMP